MRILELSTYRVIHKPTVKLRFKWLYLFSYFILFRNNCFSVHDQNIHRLATKIYNLANDLSVGDFKNLFDFKDQYTLHIPLVNTELKGKSSIRYFGAVISNAILVNIKTATSLNGFKNTNIILETRVSVLTL